MREGEHVEFARRRLAIELPVREIEQCGEVFLVLLVLAVTIAQAGLLRCAKKAEYFPAGEKADLRSQRIGP